MEEVLPCLFFNFLHNYSDAGTPGLSCFIVMRSARRLSCYHRITSCLSHDACLQGFCVLFVLVFFVLLTVFVFCEMGEENLKLGR